MLMNGKEVNHLVVGGETFDKSNLIGRKVKGKGTDYAMPLSFDPKTGKGVWSTKSVCGLLTSSTWEIVAQARVLNYVYLVEPNYIYGGWAHLSDLEFIDETGGVNSPSYLLLLYLLIALLAWEVAFLC